MQKDTFFELPLFDQKQKLLRNQDCHKSPLQGFFFFFNFGFIYLFIFMAVLGLRFCVRAFSSCGKWGPFFIAVRRTLTVAASLVAEHRLQTRRLSNCGSWAQLLRGMWDLPIPGLEPVSSALAGRFSTTAPPGKPGFFFYSQIEDRLGTEMHLHKHTLLCNFPHVYLPTVCHPWKPKTFSFVLSLLYKFIGLWLDAIDRSSSSNHPFELLITHLYVCTLHMLINFCLLLSD